MKKSHAFNERSNSHFCKKCGKPIKQRLVEQKTNVPDLCFRCHFTVQCEVRGVDVNKLSPKRKRMLAW